MRKKLKDLYDGICAVLKAINELRGHIMEVRVDLSEMKKDLVELKAEMDARGEAADEMTSKANRMFEEGMASLFGYNVHNGG